MQKKFTYYLGYAFLALLLAGITAGCGGADDTPADEVAPTAAVTEMPAEDVTAAPDTEDAYPPPPAVPEVQTSYPAPEEDTRARLAFDKPLQAGDTTVSGVGPPRLTVYILNTTLMGQELGSGVIDADGRFEVTVTGLEPGTRIGLTADPSDIGMQPEDIQPGDNPLQVPQVGNFYDSFVIPQN